MLGHQWVRCVSQLLCRTLRLPCSLLLFVFRSHLQAGAGWTGVGAISNGGMVEPTQGVNGTMLANQSGMGTAGYHTH